MSRRRVITGTDDRGRPIATWEDVASVDEPRYGHMEPAYDARTVERRPASDEDRARWASETLPAPRQAAPATKTPPKDRYTPDELQQRRQRGQAAMRAAIAPPPPREELPVTEPATDVPELAAGPFTDIAAAAIEAAHRQEAVTAARIATEAAEKAYQEALTALEAAWQGAGLASPGLPFLDTVPRIPAHDEEPAAVPAAAAAAEPRARRGEKLASGLTSRQEQVLEAMRDGGTVPKAAGILRTSDANVRVTLKKIAERGLMPDDVIALLPASWAKYSSTVAA